MAIKIKKSKQEFKLENDINGIKVSYVAFGHFLFSCPSLLES